MSEQKDLKKFVSMRGAPFYRRDVRLRRALCGFEFAKGCGFTSFPQREFKPLGLAIWGAPPLATMQQALIGSTNQVLVSYSGVPARFFAMGDSYEQIAKLMDEGKEPPGWCDWDVIELGQRAAVMVRSREGDMLGPDDGVEICFWGTAIDG